MNAKNRKNTENTPTTRRFQALFDSGLLTDRDRSFLDSLLSSYKRSGSLTAGRRQALEKVEARIQETRNNPVSVDTATETRLNGLLSSGALDSWATTFVSSLLSQVKVGRTLSAAQTAHLVKIEGKIKANADFASTYDDAARTLFSKAVNYYRSTSYFSDVVAKHDSDSSFVPPAIVFEKMTNNPYFRKVLAAMEEPAKFSDGDIVRLGTLTGENGRSTWVRIREARRGDLGQSMHTYDKAGATVIRGMVLKSEGNPVVSAVKGGKQYSVLFFGASTPVLVEERWLRRSK
jgi:hypothetical protein